MVFDPRLIENKEFGNNLSVLFERIYKTNRKCRHYPRITLVHAVNVFSIFKLIFVLSRKCVQVANFKIRF